MSTGIVRVSIIAMVMLATFGITSAQEAAKLPVTGPVLSNTGHDADAYGADEGYSLGTLATGAEMRHLVATYSHFDELTPARIVARAAAASSFQRAAEPEIYYSFGGESRTIADYLSRQPTTGLLLARDDTILRTLSIRAIGPRSLSLPVDGEDHHRDADRHRYGRRSHQIDR
jgi:hypothetical protein